MLLASAPLIISRLKSVCTISPEAVYSTADLASVKESAQVTPARHVILHSFSPRDEHDGVGLWREIYLVVHVVKNARQGVGVEAIRNDAGALVQDTLSALSGWKPAGASSALKVISPPNPLITAAFGYFALAFSVDVTTDGADGL